MFLASVGSIMQQSVNDVSTDSASSTPLQYNRSKSPTSEVDRVLAERIKQHEEAISDWNSANELREEAKGELAELQSRIQALEREKPLSPKYETREWGTFDRKYKTDAALVKTDTKSVTLRKPDGTEVTVPKLKLRTEDILYISSTFSETAGFEASLKRWENEKERLLSRLPSVQDLAGSRATPMPGKPTRADVASELAAAEAKRREDARLAEDAKREAEALAASEEKAYEDRFGNEFEAERFAKKFVKDNMRFPEEASVSALSFFDPYKMSGLNGKWVFSGEVTGKNALGVKIRNKWKCTLLKDGSTWREIETLIFE